MNKRINFDSIPRHFSQRWRTKRRNVLRDKPPLGVYEAVTEGLDRHLRRQIGDLINIPWKKIGRLEVWQILESPYATGPDLIAGPTPGQFRSIRKKLSAVHSRLTPRTLITRQLKEHLSIEPSERDPMEVGVTWRVEQTLVPVPCPEGKALEGEETPTAQEMRLVVDNLRHVHVLAAYDRLVSLYELIDRNPVAAAIIVNELKRLDY
ncbi:MAG: hypothetical protein AAB473_02575 [Patescibacteria group bacterium]